MTDDLSKVPRRLRRFYRHGEPVPEGMENKSSESENTREERDSDQAEREPWERAHEKQTPSSPSPRTARREMRRSASNQNQSPPSSPSPNENPPSGLFGKIMGGLSKPRVTRVDHALGLGAKQNFETRPPNQSEKAMQEKPPPSGKNTGTPTPEMQAALQELQQLAQKEKSGGKNQPQANISLSTFHFTPAGEAPRRPQESTGNTSAPSPSLSSSSTPASSPRERMEQRRRERDANISANPNPSKPTNTSPSATKTLNTAPNANVPAHIRRRMGQLTSGNESMEQEEARPSSAEEKEPLSKEEEDDFKSLFWGNKTKKKKKTNEEDEDFSLDDDLGDDEELPLFEDEK